MGTSWSALLVLPRGMDVGALRRGIEEVLADIVAQMSPWEPDSHLSRFNRGGAGTWFQLPERMLKVLSAALEWAERTGGAYDPTIGASVNLWGFGPVRPNHTVPDAHAIATARARTDWSRVKIEGGRALQTGGVQLDLCAIAKGFAVDEVATFLLRAGVTNFLVEIGGELRGEGVKPDGSPWWVEFEAPRAALALPVTIPETLIALSGASVATSGDEQRCFESGGRRYGHTLDPRTGAPLDHDLISVTVVDPSCMTADVLATALLVLGPKMGPDFASAHRLAARFVAFDGRYLAETLSPALKAMLD